MSAQELQSALAIIAKGMKLEEVTITTGHDIIKICAKEDIEDVRELFTNDELSALDGLGFFVYESDTQCFSAFV